MSNSYKSSMLKTSAIYFIGQMSSRFLSILLLPLYTNYINTDAYGYFDIVQTYLNVAVPFFFFEVWSAMLRFALEESEENGKKRVITNCFCLCGIGLVLFCGVYYVFIQFVSVDYNLYVFLYGITWMLQLMAMAACRGVQDNIAYALTGIIGVLTVSGISVLGVFVFKWGIEVLFISNICSFIVQTVFVLIKTKFYRYIELQQIRKDVLVKLLRFCIPLSVNTIFYWLLNSINRVIIVNNLGYGANGIYSVANKLGNIVTALVSIFMLSWQETVYKLDYQKKNEIQEIYDSEFGDIKKLLAIGVVCLLPFTNLFFDVLIGKDYAEAFGLILPMYLMVFVTSMNSFLDVVYSAVHNTRTLLYVKIVSGSVNVIGMLLLVDKIGLYSSPIAIVIAQTVALILNVLLLRPYVKVKVGIKFLLVFGVAFVITSWIYLYQSKLVNFGWLFVLGICALFILRKTLVYYFGIIKNKIQKNG